MTFYVVCALAGGAVGMLCFFIYCSGWLSKKLPPADIEYIEIPKTEKITGVGMHKFKHGDRVVWYSVDGARRVGTVLCYPLHALEGVLRVESKNEESRSSYHVHESWCRRLVKKKAPVTELFIAELMDGSLVVKKTYDEAFRVVGMHAIHQVRALRHTMTK